MVKISGCSEIWIAEGTNPLNKVELPGNDDIIGEQLEEFLKMIRGEENGLVTPQYGKQVIEVLVSAFTQFA